jgi:hypothetical protein
MVAHQGPGPFHPLAHRILLKASRIRPSAISPQATAATSWLQRRREDFGFRRRGDPWEGSVIDLIHFHVSGFF